MKPVYVIRDSNIPRDALLYLHDMCDKKVSHWNFRNIAPVYIMKHKDQTVIDEVMKRGTTQIHFLFTQELEAINEQEMPDL